MVIGESSWRRPSATFGGRLHGALPENRIRRGKNGLSNISCEASGNKIT